jgi:hypothetical protein
MQCNICNYNKKNKIKELSKLNFIIKKNYKNIEKIHHHIFFNNPKIDNKTLVKSYDLNNVKTHINNCLKDFDETKHIRKIIEIEDKNKDKHSDIYEIKREYEDLKIISIYNDFKNYLKEGDPFKKSKKLERVKDFYTTLNHGNYINNSDDIDISCSEENFINKTDVVKEEVKEKEYTKKDFREELIDKYGYRSYYEIYNVTLPYTRFFKGLENGCEIDKNYKEVFRNSNNDVYRDDILTYKTCFDSEVSKGFDNGGDQSNHIDNNGMVLDNVNYNGYVYSRYDYEKILYVAIKCKFVEVEYDENEELQFKSNNSRVQIYVKNIT